MTPEKAISDAKRAMMNGEISDSEALKIICKNIGMEGARLAFFMQGDSGLWGSFDFESMKKANAAGLFRQFNETLREAFPYVEAWRNVVLDVENMAFLAPAPIMETIGFLWNLGRRYLDDSAAWAATLETGKVDSEKWEIVRTIAKSYECAFRKLKECFWDLSGAEGTLFDYMDKRPALVRGSKAESK